MHRADQRADQAVHQEALALLELPDHQHPDPVVEQPGPGLLQPRLEVGAPVGRDGRERGVEGLDRQGLRHCFSFVGDRPSGTRSTWLRSGSQTR